MNTVYVVAATGGWDMPSFISATNLVVASAKFTEWTDTLLEESGSRVDLLEITTNEDGTTKTTILNSIEYWEA